MALNKIVSERTICRLPKYLHYLEEMEEKGFDRVSSNSIANALGTTASQVRQDLSVFGSYGSQGYGYGINRLYEEIKGILGIKKLHKVAVIGIGSLGHALIEHLDFTKYNFQVVAGFDVAPELIDTMVNDVPIYGMEKLSQILKDENIEICVLTVPKDVAKKVAAQLEKLKVPAIWNFTNVNLNLSEDVVVQNIDFLDSLFVLSYYLQQGKMRE